MNIAVDGKNFFDTGWLACFLGLPRVHPSASALRSGDLAAFEDGWDMCNETPVGYGFPTRLDAFVGMAVRGQATVCWQDDEGNEIPIAGG